jgi:hypothetical protein
MSDTDSGNKICELYLNKCFTYSKPEFVHQYYDETLRDFRQTGAFNLNIIYNYNRKNRPFRRPYNIIALLIKYGLNSK